MWYFGRKKRKKWAILGLGVEKHKVVCLRGERNWLLIAEVNKAVADPTNRSGTMAAKA